MKSAPDSVVMGSMKEAAMHEPGVLAAGEEPVRQYLRRLGMPEADISLYLDEARKGLGPATFSFGTDDEGLIPQLSSSGDDSCNEQLSADRAPDFSVLSLTRMRRGGSQKQRAPGHSGVRAH
jgi:hypothetical protein